ncbi:autotransporter domain-containing protein [Hoeflea sp. WL0058]|uniref:Autotransporter domain-containing protein n=1 Tax=Flavimaribacter sediminis TaxID=2865987 RepID=A0AAE2ZRI3_9HYPH|nr:autotransporter domain-containing protein [Flavimaribacter sediminis]MBW8640679.1 autotransporter domain-containing protein [Flavimaribacter sediminis]
MCIKQNSAVYAVLFWLFASSFSFAQSWDNEVGDVDWFNPTNWDTDLLPDGTQDVIVDTTGETVQITDQDPDAPAQTRNLTLGSTAGANGELTISSGGIAQTAGFLSLGHGVNSTGTLIVTGADSMITVADNISVGTLGTGTLRVEDGATVTANADTLIGYSGDAVGEATISGAGSTLDIASGELIVGYAADGTLTVEDGGLVTSNLASIGSTPGSLGTATVTGANSQWNNTTTLYVGNAGTGTLTVENGGTVVNTGAVVVGVETGATGLVEVTGTGSSLATSSLNIGQGGSGSLLINDGATVTNEVTNLAIGSGSPAVATVSGSGSSWTSDTMFVGIVGSGALTIEDGGSVTTETTLIALPGGTASAATVSGAGSTWTNTGAVFSIGLGGDGTLTIREGGLVSATDMSIAQSSGSKGTLNIGAAAGEAPAAPGTLDASTLAFGDGTGKLIFNHTDTTGAYEFAPGMSSGGGLSTIEHLAGYTNLTGDSSGFAGRTYAEGGTLAITGGGVLGGSYGAIGDAAGSDGAVFVSGAGSMWSMSKQLYVGVAGTGTLTIADGGMVSNDYAYVGETSGTEGAVTVTGAGSTWTNANEIYMGLSGAGTLKIEQGGSVSATNSYLGVNSGSEGTATVMGSNSSWTNSGNLYVGYEGDGTLTIEDGGVVTNTAGYIGEASGSEGTVTVSGAGSTWTNSGNLFVGLKGAAALSIADGGMVSSTTGYIGYLSPSEGVVTVSGPNSTWTNSIGLVVGSYSNGSLTLSNGGLVSSPEVAIARDSVEGTLNIGAAAGETAAAPGTLDTPSLLFDAGWATLVFNHTDETGLYEFAPDMSSDYGRATIEHFAGFTRLTGDSSGFGDSCCLAKTTNIYGGTLAIENMLGGPVNVMSGGTLGGSGTATGDVTFNSGSYYLVEMDGTTSDQGLTVEGTATLDGTVMLAGDYASTGMGDVVVLTSQTQLTTTFDGVELSTPSLFLSPFLSYDDDGIGDDHVYVLVEQLPFATFAETPNQRSVAGALDGLPGSTSLIGAILMIETEEEVRDAYDQLSGEAHASLKGALLENGQRTAGAVNDRIHNAFDGTDANTSVAAYGDISDAVNGFWITGYGDWISTDATFNTAAADSDLYGVVAGFDRKIGDYARLGILVGYSRTDTSVDARASEADANSYTLGVYGGADNGNAVLSLGALYTWHSVDSSRFVTNPVSEQLVADYDARSYQFFAEAGYRMTTGAATFEPFAGVSYISLKTNAFAETGGMAALASPSQTTSTTFTTLGLRAAVAVTDSARLTGMAGWRHAFGDIDPASTFTIAGSTPFSVLGAPIAEDAAVVEAGIDFVASDTVTIGAAYEGQYGDGAIANGFNARIVAAF